MAYERDMEQRVSVITLGVSDLAAARSFYERLGWHSDSPVEEDVVFFQAGELVIGLWGRDQLAEDSAVTDAGGWGGVTLAYNVTSPGHVDEVIAVAEQAGARIGRRGAPTFWGGYSGVFIDPDGHPWEVAHNPYWTTTDTGAVRLPGRTT
jgi:catechol 2,3-dioxygenase-like lactoylglutathione lyase family enzyme